MTEPLSLAAQAVLDAAYALPLRNGQPSLAAAIIALVDQVLPDEGDCWKRDMRGDAWIRWEERKLIRAEIFAIAAELEGGATTITTPQEAQ
jgi:hypothetical protein